MVKLVLENVLVEFVIDIVYCGVVFIGGGVLFVDFECLLYDEIGLVVWIVDELVICVVCGVGEVMG